MTEVDLVRTNHLIDPQLHIWGWEIPVYLFLGGLTAGMMILSALMKKKGEALSTPLRLLPFAAPLVLSLGMAALFLDLEFKLHVYRFYLAFEVGSPMSWGSWLLLGIYPATLLLGALNLSETEFSWLERKFGASVKRLAGKLRTFATTHSALILNANLALGMGLGIYTGILLSSLGRPAWNSAILGPLFLVSGFSAGAAFCLLLSLKESEYQRIRKWDLIAIGSETALILLYLIGLSKIGAPPAADLFLGGRFTAVFWTLVVGMGLLTPLVIEGIESRRHLPATRLAPALVLAGGFALRWIIVMAGQ